jgi:hypothetical protein
MASRKITLYVPTDFIVPQIYTEGTPADVATALKLGAESVDIMHKRAIDVVRQETHAEVVKQATAELEELLSQTTQTTNVSLTKLRQEKTKAEEAARAAMMRVEALENSAAEQRARIQKEVRESVHELLAAKDEQIHRLQQTMEKTVDGMGKRVESLQQSITKTFASSKEKGSLGEAIMERIMKLAYDCDVHVVSKGAETADIRMTRPNAAYFWEIKNYTRMVSTEEVNKFRRDLRLHPDVRGGIMVSLRQGIVGKSRGGDIDVEFLEDGRFVLYISNFMSHEDPVFYLQTLRPFFETIEAMAKPLKEETEVIRTLEMKAMLMTNLLRAHAIGVTKHKNALVGHRKRTDAMFAEFSSYILEAEAQLQTVLRVAMGGDGEANSVLAETETYLPAIVFAKEHVSDFADDKIREFVKWLLTVAEVREGTQIEIKDVLEKARKEGYGEKFVRGLREDVFQETAWVKGSRFIMGLRFVEKIDIHGA